MLKYVDTMITFSEFPDEISLCINISNCPNHCIGCHSPELTNDIGELLYPEILYALIDKNDGITCVGIMGGDSESKYVNTLAKIIKDAYNLKVGWYSGKQELSKDIELNNFNYIKLGSYIEELGGLDNPSTNQRMYLVDNNKLIDITSKFWK